MDVSMDEWLNGCIYEWVIWCMVTWTDECVDR